jgi:glycosyltransferase involved in cell wall biosynthesis
VRLVFVSHSADLMGAELGLVSLVGEAVKARGHEATVLVPRDGPLVAELTNVGAKVVVLPTWQWMGRRYNPVVGSVRLLQAAASVPHYRRYLGGARPDLVFTNSAAVPAGAVAARLAGIRHVWLVQESLLTNPSLRVGLPRRAIARIIVNLSDGVVALSDYVADQLLRAAPTVAEKLRVIPPPIDFPIPASSAAEALGPRKLRRLVLLGRFTPEKGQADAVAAVGICRRKGYPLRLKLAAVGDAHARRALGGLARTHGVSELVEMCEWTDDPHGLYSWADATLMLSRNEAYGRVTVESLRSGTPVIGYRAGGTTELVAPGGGVLVEPGVEALADALVNLAAHDESYGQIKAAALRRKQRLSELPSSASTFLAYLERLHANR